MVQVGNTDNTEEILNILQGLQAQTRKVHIQGEVAIQLRMLGYLHSRETHKYV